MDIKEKLNQYGRPLAVALVVIVAIVGISLASNDESGDSDNNNQQQTVENSDQTQSDSTDSNEPEGEASEDENVEIGTEPEAGPVEVESTDNTYKAAARAGDNQTVIARQIVADFLSDEDKSLNAAQRLYAETNLVNELGRNDLISVGYVAELSKDQVSEVVSAAEQLSESQQDLWSNYL